MGDLEAVESSREISSHSETEKAEVFFLVPNLVPSPLILCLFKETTEPLIRGRGV